MLDFRDIRRFELATRIVWMMLPSKKKGGQPWQKALMHFLLCFFVGTMMGFVPFGSLISMGYYNEPSSNIRGAITVQAVKHEEKVQRNFSLVGNMGRFMGQLNPGEAALENSVSVKDEEELDNFKALEARKPLIIVTTTENHPFQALYLTRLAHTLRLVPPPLLWIVVETPTQSVETAQMLRNTGVMYRHLVSNKNTFDHQRDVALEHIEKHQLNGILYFAEERNFYSLKLFEQLRQIKRFGVWSVAKLSQNKPNVILEGPVCNSTEVIGWHVEEWDKLVFRFYASHSGYAFNSTILWDPKIWGRPNVDFLRHAKNGTEKSTFIEQLVSEEHEMEGLANACSQILVWDMRMEALLISYPSRWTMDSTLEPRISLVRHLD